MRPVSTFQIVLFVIEALVLLLFSTTVAASSARVPNGVRNLSIDNNLRENDGSEQKGPLSNLILHHDSPPSFLYEGEVVVSTGALTVHGPPKGLPEKRRSRDLANKQEFARGKQSKSLMKYMKKMWPYMLVPVMMSMGYAPFMLSSLKMFVMTAMMVNMMAFNAAIFLTLRNMVFGPRQGGHVKYYNFGYKNHHRHRRSSSIIRPLG